MAYEYARVAEISAEEFAVICDRIRTTGNVRRALRQLKVHPDSFYRYVGLTEGAREIANQAKIDGLDAVADEIIDIGETPRMGKRLKKSKDKDGKVIWEAVYGDNVERSRLDSHNKMWLLAKLWPSKYGDRIAVDATVRDAEAKVLEGKLRDGRARLKIVG